MIDARFFQTGAALSVDDVARISGGEIVRNGAMRISRVAPLSVAGPQDLAFLSDKKLMSVLGECQAGCVILSPDLADHLPESVAVIGSREPQAAWARVALHLHMPLVLDEASDPQDACEDDTVRLEPGVVLGQGVRIGSGTRIGANTVIGPGVQIGRDCAIGANASVVFALIGDRVKIYAGARIGEAGFGAAGSATGPVDVPQLGRVILQDGVTIGANTCVDRGAYDDTIVGENAKIDNLVQIGHNSVIGRNVLMAAHSGLSGSVTVGDNVMFGGRAGVGDHITIGEGARIAAGGGVLANVPPGETWSGYPAKPIRQFLRETVWLSKQVARKKGEGRD